MDEHSETLEVQISPKSYAYASITVMHDQSGGSNGIELSLSAYNQLRNHFLCEGKKTDTSDSALPIDDVVGNEVAVCKHEYEKLDWDSPTRIDCECGESFYRFTN